MEFNRKTSRIRTLYFDKPTDIIITDPCYYIKNEDWHEPSWGPKFSESFATDTLYGDIIKNFEGEIRFYKETCEYFSPYDFKWSGVKKGDIQQDRGLYIVGIGKINFITAQTGL